MEWNSSHFNPPKVGQKIYYFGKNIGIGIGHYSYEERILVPYTYNEKNEKEYANKEIKLCPHIFTNLVFGVVDACDAPFWLPYDEERAKSWCPIIPEQYTKDLYD